MHIFLINVLGGQEGINLHILTLNFKTLKLTLDSTIQQPLQYVQ